MPSNEDLSDQLSLTTKLASMLERMAAASGKIEQSYASQIDSVTKLAAAMGQINTQGAVAGIEVLNKSVKDMQDKMKQAGGASESAFQKLGKKVEDTGKTFKDKFPKSVVIATAALSGFAQGVRNIIALGKGLTGFVTGFVDGIFSLGAAIIAIPFKIFEGLVDMAAKSAGGSNELMQAIEGLRKEFGFLYGTTNKTIIDMTKSLQGFSDTGLSAWRIFGNMAQRLEAFQKLATEMGATFTSLRKEFEANGGALLAYQKGLGISDELMKGVASRAIAMGDSLGDTLKSATKYSLELAKAFGLDAKVLSRDMAKALTDVKHFAGATIKEIGEAATYARKLGLELDKITGTLDAFETFDSAAENVAKLSQAFGVQADAFELMSAQNPAEQIDILRKSFSKAGVDASTFNRQQLKLLASTTGLDEATAKQAFSLKNQGIGLDQVKKKGGEAEKKTLTQAEAMGKLADAIERMVQSGGGMEGGFWDQFVKGIKNGIMSSKEFFGLMRNIQIALRDVYMIGVQLGRVLVKIVPGFKDILGGLSDFFQPKYFDKLFRGISDSVKRFFSPDSPDKNSIPKLIEGLQKSFTDMFTAEGPHGKRILEGFKTFFKAFSGIAASAITWLADQIRDGIKVVIDLLTGRTKLGTAGAKGAAAGGLGFLADVLGPVVESLKGAWQKLKDPLHDLVMQLGKMLKTFLTSDEFIGFIKPALPYLATALFGPVFTRAILGAVTASLAKGAIGMLTGGGGQAVIKQVAAKAAASLSGKVEGGLLGKAGGLAGRVAGPAALVVAALAIGKGVDEYTDQITSTLDRSSKVIGAGATGVVDALTLGLLPDDLKLKLANTMASVTDSVFGAIKSAFGEGFGNSLKQTLASAFEVFGNIWSVLSNLFTGDQASFNQSVLELGASLLRFVINAVEYTLNQAPLLLVKLGTKVIDGLGGIIIKMVTGFGSLLASGVDEVFGTHLADKMKQWGETVNKGMDAAAAAIVKTTDQNSKQIADATQNFNDTYLRTSADKAKIAASAALSATQATNDAVKQAADAAGGGLSKVAENLQAVKDAKKQLDDKDFDVAGALKSIGDKLRGVSFNLISDDQLADIDKSNTGLQSLHDLVGTIPTTLGDISSGLKATSFNFISDDQLTDMSKSLKGFKALDKFSTDVAGSFSNFTDLSKAAATIKKGAIAEAAMAISDMVAAANELDSALADGNINKIDVKAKLDRVAKAVGLGGKATYTVNPSKQVQIVVNLEVTMDVDKVEKVMIMRQQSIIRDRLNFATDNPAAKGVTTVPSTYQATLPNVQGGSQ